MVLWRNNVCKSKIKVIHRYRNIYSVIFMNDDHK